MIQLTDEWKIAASGAGWKLVHTIDGTSKEGEAIRTDITKGYFGSLGRALRAYADECAKTAESVPEAVDTLRECLSQIKAVTT